MMSHRELTQRSSQVTIADTLYDAAKDIRGYIEDDMVPSDKLEDEIMGIVAMMDALRAKIDALGEVHKSQAQEEITGNHSA
jgi:hypothetical protein